MFRRRSRILTQLSLILTLGLSACASVFGDPVTPTPTQPTPTPVPPTATPPPSAAIVNGEYITLSEFESELERYKSALTARNIPFTEEEAEQVVLDDLIAQVLLAQGARETGFDLTDAELQSRVDALAAQIGGAEALSKWKSDHGFDDTAFLITLKRAAEAAWMRDKIIADVPTSIEQVHLRQILTYNAEDAQAALNELNGGADFDEVAARYDPVTRGELGWVPPGYLLDTKADEAVFALQVGAHTDVIATDAGFHIFKVIERGEHLLTPDALRTVQEQALKEWLAEQRLQSEISLAP